MVSLLNIILFTFYHNPSSFTILTNENNNVDDIHEKKPIRNRNSQSASFLTSLHFYIQSPFRPRTPPVIFRPRRPWCGPVFSAWSPYPSLSQVLLHRCIIIATFQWHFMGMEKVVIHRNILASCADFLHIRIDTEQFKFIIPWNSSPGTSSKSSLLFIREGNIKTLIR